MTQRNRDSREWALVDAGGHASVWVGSMLQKLLGSHDAGGARAALEI